jgi:hypothetical protein
MDAQYSFLDDQCRVLVDQVQEPSEPGSFPGLYLDCLPGGPNSSIATDPPRLYVTSQWRSWKRLLQIDTSSGAVRPLLTDWEGSAMLLDSMGDLLLLLYSSPNNPGTLILHDAQTGLTRSLWQPWAGYEGLLLYKYFHVI